MSCNKVVLLSVIYIYIYTLFISAVGLGFVTIFWQFFLESSHTGSPNISFYKTSQSLTISKA